MSIKNILSLIENSHIKFIDLRFTDTKGKDQHITISTNQIDEDLFNKGKMFDGSSISGWKSINESDMVLLPDPSTVILDPFFADKTLIIRCDILEPCTMQGYDKDPRTISKRAEKFLLTTGIADVVFFGPELEFFVFDDIRFGNYMHSSYYYIDDIEAAWNTGSKYKGGNKGHRPGIGKGYFPIPPIDSSQNLRSAMCSTMETMGLIVETHHHEVATAGQNEISTRFNTMTKKADETQIYKYVVHNVANSYGKTATFMPKPLINDNGSGMHCHMSLLKNGINIFSGNKYGGLSEISLYYIGGIIKHARTLNAFTNPTTNSYKRLVPGFEAPVMLTYSIRNRSSSIRIPVSLSKKSCRIEVRFPDPSANPYLAFSAQLMAGIDGIINKIHPGEAIDKNLYDLSLEEKEKIPTVSNSLKESLLQLDKNRSFLSRGGVFTDNAIDAYIKLLFDDIKRINQTPNPLEFEMYYSV
ncbi:Glutamine synthetase [Candidatus Providencia siddallii]|uniref:Glutamine synthetase n=1 Tax=Candidatus Providencia siddallii TaxID=1715285 RepID=A0A0M6W8R9_9GAMM|nr:Glutamine synthetase [Candidatus Providencia siddallii]